MIPRIDAAKLLAGDTEAMKLAAEGAMGVGFLTVFNTPLPVDAVKDMIDRYAGIFHLPGWRRRLMIWRRWGPTAAGVRQVLNRSIRMQTLITNSFLIAV